MQWRRLRPRSRAPGRVASSCCSKLNRASAGDDVERLQLAGDRRAGIGSGAAVGAVRDLSASRPDQLLRPLDGGPAKAEGQGPFIAADLPAHLRRQLTSAQHRGWPVDPQLVLSACLVSNELVDRLGRTKQLPAGTQTGLDRPASRRSLEHRQGEVKRRSRPRHHRGPGSGVLRLVFVSSAGYPRTADCYCPPLDWQRGWDVPSNVAAAPI